MFIFYTLLFLVVSFAAATAIINLKVYEGFESAPEDWLERLIAIIAIPGMFFWVVFRLIQYSAEPAPTRPSLSLRDYWHYVRWTFSTDKA